jgi:hypothetical protein
MRADILAISLSTQIATPNIWQALTTRSNGSTLLAETSANLKPCHLALRRLFSTHYPYLFAVCRIARTHSKYAYLT